MKDADCVRFLQWALPRMNMRWPGFRKVRRQVGKRIDRRLRKLGLANVDAYRDYLESHADEWAVLDSFCRISISRFYRDKRVFDLLREEVLPELAGAARASPDGVLRCWSAGCASGEEPYTINIIWQRYLAPRFPGVTLRILASDSSPVMLDRAREGCYPASSLKDAPEDWVATAFTKSGEEWCIEPEFRGAVDFVLQDIRSATPDERFHLVLCRHSVFTYFHERLQRETLPRILQNLLPGGFFVTGKQEPLPEAPAELRQWRPHAGIYRKVGAIESLTSND